VGCWSPEGWLCTKINECPLRGQVDCHHFNINNFIAAGEIDSQQIFPIELTELGADEFIDIGGIRKIKRFEKLY
jgi:hypothetical protein